MSAMRVVLTEREREIAQLAAEHHSNTAIARQLGVSVKTVEAHLYNISLKLPGSEPLRRRIYLHRQRA